MARRSKPRSHTKCGVVVCEVGQAFWLLELEDGQKVGRLCHCCCYFLLKNYDLGNQGITFESTGSRVISSSQKHDLHQLLQ